MSHFDRSIKKCGSAKSNDRRNQQDFEDFNRLIPVDTGSSSTDVNQLVGHSDADDGADHGVGA